MGSDDVSDTSSAPAAGGAVIPSDRGIPRGSSSRQGTIFVPGEIPCKDFPKEKGDWPGRQQKKLQTVLLAGKEQRELDHRRDRSLLETFSLVDSVVESF